MVVEPPEPNNPPPAVLEVPNVDVPLPKPNAGAAVVAAVPNVGWVLVELNENPV